MGRLLCWSRILTKLTKEKLPAKLRFNFGLLVESIDACYRQNAPALKTSINLPRRLYKYNYANPIMKAQLFQLVKAQFLLKLIEPL
jgi:hypothetical protein